MKYISELIKIIIINLIIIFVFSNLSYFNIINDNILLVISYLLFYLIIFISGFKLGKKKEKDGYLEGLKLGSLLALLLFIIRLLFIRKDFVKKIIYYLLIIIVSTIGSVIGINKKIKS